MIERMIAEIGPGLVVIGLIVNATLTVLNAWYARQLDLYADHLMKRTTEIDFWEDST